MTVRGPCHVARFAYMTQGIVRHKKNSICILYCSAQITWEFILKQTWIGEDFIKYSNCQDENWFTNVQNPEVDAGFMSRLLSVHHGFDQIVSKLGNEGVIGKPRGPTPVNVTMI